MQPTLKSLFYRTCHVTDFASLLAVGSHVAVGTHRMFSSLVVRSLFATTKHVALPLSFCLRTHYSTDTEHKGDLYAVLGVQQRASASEIKQAFRKVMAAFNEMILFQFQSEF